MATLLEQQVTIVLTNALGRAPTAEEIRLGTLAPYPLSDIHNTANVAQNTLSISTTDDIQVAINKINANGGGVVYLNPGTYNVTTNITLPSNIYLIGLVSSLCIIDFGGTASSIVSDTTGYSGLEELTIQNSSSNGIEFLNNTGLLTINNVRVLNCAIGLLCNNCSSGVNIIEGGMEIRNCVTGIGFYTGVGLIIFDTTVLNCSGSGIEIGNSTFVLLSSVIVELCFDGIVCVNVDANSFQSMYLARNTRDGLRLDTGSSGNRIFGSSITNNGGYGVNLVVNTDVGNVLSVNQFFNNTSGAVNDSGTNTLIRSNIGVADN